VRNFFDSGRTWLSWGSTNARKVCDVIQDSDTEVFDFAAERGECPYDPPPVFQRRLAERPVSRMRLWNDQPVWMVMRHADVRAVLTDQRFSANNLAPGFPLITPSGEALTQDNPTFVRLDPPEHGRLRGMVNPEFTMKRAIALRPQIQEIVDELVDAMVEKGSPAELVEDFALPIPTRVICLILGVPYSDHDYFQSCTRVMTDVKATEDEVAKASQALTDFLTDLIARKAEKPGDDLLSKLVVEREQPGELSRDDVVAMARLLLDAGHETTAMMISYGTLLLLRHPEQLAALRADEGLVAGTVEELLRYLTVIHTGVPRLATADVEIGGETIRAGEGVLCFLPTANRDPDRFPDPDTFDIHRTDRGHMAFGFGVHQCIGQGLARVELQIALATLIRRLPELALAVPFEELRFRHTMFVEGVYELPVTW
jgi:cytochrome P450